MLTSPGNPQVRLCRALAQRKTREREGKFVLEGVRLLEEALAAGIELERVFYCPRRLKGARAKSLVQRLGRDVELTGVSEQVLESLSDTVTPQGVVAVARRVEWKLADLELGERALLMALEDLRDPGNLGTIIRSADAAAAAAVVLCGDCVDPTNPKVVRATMGSLFHVPVVTEPEVAELGDWASANGVELLAAAADGEHLCHEVSLPRRVAFLVGGEAHGLSAQARAAAKGTVSIPMPGRAESLNAAIAASILLYEAVRRQSARLPSQPQHRQGKGDDGGK